MNIWSRPWRQIFVRFEIPVFTGMTIMMMAMFMCPAMAKKIKSPKIELPPMEATVDYIIDGDTFWATAELENSAKVRIKIRFINNDAPEISGECERERKMAQASRARLGEIIPVGSKIQLTHIKDDKYQGRIDAYVLKDGKDVGEQMISEGYAVPYDGGKRDQWCTDEEISAENQRILMYGQ